MKFYINSKLNYLTSTVAPASSSLALISSASAVGIFSLTAPLLSTISLDSFNPKPVISLTTLITATLEAPASAIVTVTVLGAASATPAPAGAATATADGSTPNSYLIASTNSLISNKFISFKLLIKSSFVNLAILFPPIFFYY